MMKLSGNKWMQKREIENNMKLHYKNLKEKTSTGASYRNENPRKSMLNRRKQEIKQKEINEQNEKLIGKLYEILTSNSNRPYSPQKKNKPEPHEVTRQIQIQSRQSRQERRNKEIGEANLQLLEAITTVQSEHNPALLEKDYIERKRVVERLRTNTSSTALHLLNSPTVLNQRPKSAPKERPKSAGSLPSWYTSLANKVSDREKISRVHPYLQNSPSAPHPAFPSAIYSTENSSNEVPNKVNQLIVQTSFDNQSPTSPSTFSNFNYNSSNYDQVKDDIEITSSSQFQKLQGEQNEKLEQQGGENEIDKTLIPHSPRKVLLTEIDMRGIILTPSLSSPQRNLSLSTFDSLNIPNPAVFVVRVYDVGRFQAKNSQPMSSGLVIESKILPETEKSVSDELFLPIKQLRSLVDRQHSETSIYDSLGRKLKRLKCIDRELGLYPDLSNYLPASFLEQLCDLVLRNIETIIIPRNNHHNSHVNSNNNNHSNHISGYNHHSNGYNHQNNEIEIKKRNYDVKIRIKSFNN